MAASLGTATIPVCYEIRRKMSVDPDSESYKKRQIEFPDEVTFQLFDNNNPQRDDMSLHQVLLLVTGQKQKSYNEDDWDDYVDDIKDELKKPEFRRANDLSDCLEIVCYGQNFTKVIELIYSEMSEVEFNKEFEKHIDSLRQKGVKHPLSLRTGIKRLVYFSEHRKMVIHDLRRLPPEKRARTSAPRPQKETEH